MAKKGLIAIAILLVVIATFASKLDIPAMEQVDAGIKRAFVTFAAARTLNAAISLAQGTEVSLGIGAEVTMSVGEILDPVNDLVETFSDFMLIATVAFGIQKVLLLIGQYEYVKLLLTVVLIGWGALYVAGKTPPRWLSNLLVVMLMTRFAIPIVTVGSDFVFQQFLEKDYHSSQAALSSTAGSIKQLTLTEKEPAQEKTGWFDHVKKSVTKLDPRPHLESLKTRADEAVRHSIELIVIFVLQTLLLPLFLLWALFFVLKSSIYTNSNKSLHPKSAN